jgi:hypothetical protein
MVALLAAALLLAAPQSPGAPNLKALLGSDMIARAKVRWTRLDDGARATVEIQGGEAIRINPNWSPEPVHLAYDLDRERALIKLVRAGRLPSPTGRRGLDADGRQLELYAEVRTREKLEWLPVASWVLPARSWRKGRLEPIFSALEPLLDIKPELYAPLKPPPTAE